MPLGSAKLTKSRRYRLLFVYSVVEESGGRYADGLHEGWFSEDDYIMIHELRGHGIV